MSEVTESTTVESTTSEVVDAAVDTSTEATTDAVEVAEAPAAEPKFEYPKKFLKPDGTPDHERAMKAYLNLEKKFGTKPNMPAASIDDYEGNGGVDLDLPEENVAAFKTELLEQGFTKDQYKFIMKRYEGIVNAMTFDADKTEAILKETWGDDFKPNMRAYTTGFDAVAPQDADRNDPVWRHPHVVQALAAIGKEFGEDSLTPKSKIAPSSAESFQEQVNALRSKPNWESDPKIQAELNSLYEKQYK